MEDRGYIDVGPISPQNGPISPQHSFDNVDFQDLSFEGADFWTSQEGFFDITEGLLPALPASDAHLPIGGPGIVEEDGHLTAGQCVAHVSHLHDLDDGDQDSAFHSEDLERVGCNTSPVS
jgi:hypothetical protein